MNEPTNDSIVFYVKSSGKLEPTWGNTGLKGLLDIGAFAHTSSYSKESGRHEFQTDIAGVQRVATMAGNALDYLHTAIQDIALLLALVEHEELPPGTLASLGWTITGLAEAAISTKEVLLEAEDQLKPATPTDGNS